MQLAPPTLSLVIDALTTRGSEAPSPIYLQVIQSIDRKEYLRVGAGGRLFLADGLFDISYGPNDIVLLDGNIPPGVTGLGDISHKAQG